MTDDEQEGYRGRRLSDDYVLRGVTHLEDSDITHDQFLEHYMNHTIDSTAAGFGITRSGVYAACQFWDIPLKRGPVRQPHGITRGQKKGYSRWRAANEPPRIVSPTTRATARKAKGWWHRLTDAIYWYFHPSR